MTSACLVSSQLSRKDTKLYGAVPSGLFGRRARHDCEMRGTHEVHGSEVAVSTEDSRMSHWVLWSVGRPYRVVRLTPCTLKRGDHTPSGQPVICLLYGGHGGDHDWYDED